MGYLSSPTSTTMDTAKFSFSGWVRVPSGIDPAYYPILEFGSDFLFDNGSSSLGITFNPGSGGVSFTFYCEGYDYSAPSGSGSTRDTWTTSLGPDIASNTWYNIMVSIDISAMTGISWVWSGPPNVSTPQFIDVQFSLAVNNVNYSGAGTLQSSNLPGNPNTQGYGTYSATDNEMLTISGYEIGIPVTSVDAANGVNEAIILAEFQAWFGTFIDFSNPGNRAMFIDGTGKPVDPAIPARAFGTQSILLRRNKDKGLNFTLNEGSGDTFTPVGTFTDFKTGPGQ